MISSKISCDSHCMKPFPKLMISNKTGNIALFVEPTVAYVDKGTDWFVGERCTSLDATNFIDFNGSVTLQND